MIKGLSLTALLSIWEYDLLNARTIPKIELLSPAGNYECFLAAIASGADAVYAGGEMFGARAYADNFSRHELLEAIDHAHLYGRKFYLTVNTILKNNEIVKLYDYISPLYAEGLDGIIVQDIGVLSVIKKMFPKLPIHASTQMSITDVEGVLLLKNMGIQRVVPARELSLEEIKQIYDQTGMELECFIHGALCYSYSGKCLFSSIVGRRSGNRGRCAQPCRLPYDGSYILSARDISTLEILPELIEAGIASFKIEGRMKSREYVGNVTGIYRKYIDRYLEAPDAPYNVEEQDRKELYGLYTRSGHCTGYYHEHNGNDMITIDKPSYSSPGKDRSGNIAERLNSRIEKLKIVGKVSAFKGAQLEIVLRYGDHMIRYTGSTVEEAKTKPVSAEDIRKQMEKLGDTCFSFDDLEIFSDDDIFIPVSILNESRRSAVKMLKEELLSESKREKILFRYDIDSRSDDDEAYIDRKVLIDCRTDTLDKLDTILKYGFVDIITIDINDLLLQTDIMDAFKRCTDKIHDAGKLVYIALPTIIRNDFFDRNPQICEILDSRLTDGAVTDNYEGLYYLKHSGYKGKILSDLHLYAANDEAVMAYKGLGTDIITYPVELNSAELSGLKLEGGEFILYGRLPMMVSAQCTSKTSGKCSRDNGLSYITDRLGNRFPVVKSCRECYNTILNCVPVMITLMSEIPDGLFPYSYRIHFTVENENEIDKVLSLYEDVFNGSVIDKPDINHTLGHLKRGVE